MIRYLNECSRFAIAGFTSQCNVRLVGKMSFSTGTLGQVVTAKVFFTLQHISLFFRRTVSDRILYMCFSKSLILHLMNSHLYSGVILAMIRIFVANRGNVPHHVIGAS